MMRWVTNYIEVNKEQWEINKLEREKEREGEKETLRWRNLNEQERRTELEIIEENKQGWKPLPREGKKGKRTLD